MTYDLYSGLDNQKNQKNSFQAASLEENSRIFQGKMEFKDFLRLCEPCNPAAVHFQTEMRTFPDQHGSTQFYYH